MIGDVKKVIKFDRWCEKRDKVDEKGNKVDWWCEKSGYSFVILLKKVIKLKRKLDNECKKEVIWMERNGGGQSFGDNQKGKADKFSRTEGVKFK